MTTKAFASTKQATDENEETREKAYAAARIVQELAAEVRQLVEAIKCKGQPKS